MRSFLIALISLCVGHLLRTDLPPRYYVGIAVLCAGAIFFAWFRNHPTKYRIRLYEEHGNLSESGQGKPLDLLKHPLSGKFVGPGQGHRVLFGIFHNLPDRKIEGVTLYLTYPIDDGGMSAELRNEWTIYSTEPGRQTASIRFNENIPKGKIKFASSGLYFKFKKAGSYRCECEIAGDGFGPIKAPFRIELTS